MEPKILLNAQKCKLSKVQINFASLLYAKQMFKEFLFDSYFLFSTPEYVRKFPHKSS